MDCEDPVLNSFVTSLADKLGGNLIEIWLFGSRARGDNDENSDYDVLIVAKGSLKELRSIVADTNYQILNTYEELIGSIVYTPDIWKRSKNGPLGINVLSQGRRIA